MDRPNYEKYTLEELYDALDHIESHNYPENYEALKAEIKKRQEEGPRQLSQEELEERDTLIAKNNKMKKIVGFSVLGIIVLIILNAVIQSIFFPPKPYEDVMMKVRQNPRIFAQIGMPFNEMKESVLVTDTIMEKGQKIPQMTYEIFVKGSKAEASIFAIYQQKGPQGKMLKEAYMILAGKEKKINIPLNQPNHQFGGDRRR